MRSTTSGSVTSCVLAPSKVSASRGTRTAGPALMAATDKGALGPAPCVAGNGDVELGDVPNGTVGLVRFTLAGSGYSCLHSSMVSLLCCGLGIGTPTTAAVSGRCPKPEARRERCGHVIALLCQTAGPGSGARKCTFARCTATNCGVCVRTRRTHDACDHCSSKNFACSPESVHWTSAF